MSPHPGRNAGFPSSHARLYSIGLRGGVTVSSRMVCRYELIDQNRCRERARTGFGWRGPTDASGIQHPHPKWCHLSVNPTCGRRGATRQQLTGRFNGVKSKSLTTAQFRSLLRICPKKNRSYRRVASARANRLKWWHILLSGKRNTSRSSAWACSFCPAAMRKIPAV